MQIDFPVLYFAYGSNLSLKQMQYRCPTAKAIVRATLPNYRLVFPLSCDSWGGGVAGIEPDNTTQVEGAVYELQAQDLAALDEYEAIEEGEYTRDFIIVHLPDGAQLSAITYFARREVPEPQDIPPSESYISTILTGAKDHRLPETYIDQLAARWLPAFER